MLWRLQPLLLSEKSASLRPRNAIFCRKSVCGSDIVPGSRHRFRDSESNAERRGNRWSMLELFVCSHFEFISFQPTLAGTGHVPMSAIARLASDEDTGDEAQNRSSEDEFWPIAFPQSRLLAVLQVDEIRHVSFSEARVLSHRVRCCSSLFHRGCNNSMQQPGSHTNSIL